MSTVVTSAASLRFPPHRLMQLGLGLATCGITILATTRSTPLLLVGMVIGGLDGAAALAPGSPPNLSVLRTVPAWWAPTIAYACFGWGYVLFSTFVVAALEKDAGFRKGPAVWVYALMGTGIATGSLVLGRLSDQLGRRAAMIGSFSSACFGCLAVLIGIEPLVSLATLPFGAG
jgi:Uncharacterised MFS-type transporter YbfB